MKKANESIQFIILGIIFSIFWSSASVAAKIGVKVLEPLVLFQFRFFLAAIVLLVYSYFYETWRWPTQREFIDLSIFGFLNVTLYLSLFVLGIKEVAAGIGSLSTSMSPLFIIILGGLVLGKKIKFYHYLGLIIGFCGVLLAVYPLLGQHYASTRGLIYFFFSILSYSVAALFFAEKTWTLPRLAINGWQVLLGGIFMLPLTLYLKQKPIILNVTSIGSILWLAIPVSVLAVNLWIRLIRIDALKASYFLFLCPISGFVFSSLILHEPFTWHTMAGLCLALVGMFLGQKK